MKLFRHIVLCGVLVLAALSLFLHPELSARAITDGLRVCAGSILPALFPFFVISNLWLYLGYDRNMSRILAPWMERFFRLPGPVSSALLLGAIGGYPAGAQTLVRLYQQNQISKQEAESALFFCSNAGPAFVFGVLGGTIFQSAAIGAVLWAIHLCSALLLGFLFRPKQRPNSKSHPTSSASRPFLPALTESIGKAGQTTILVCIFVLFFSILSQYLSALLPKTTASAILLGSLELAGGCTRLGTQHLSQETVFVLSAGLLGWGGLCVHCQTASLLYEASLSPKPYLYGKLLHGILSTAMACLTAPLLPLQVPCFAAEARPPTEAISLLCSLLALLFLKSSSGKMSDHRI